MVRTQVDSCDEGAETVLELVSRDALWLPSSLITTALEQVPLNLGRKTSWSGASTNLASPALQSPRTRFGGGSAFDGVLDRSDNPWVGGPKRRATSGQVVNERVDEADEEVKPSEVPDDKGPENSTDRTPQSVKDRGSENVPESTNGLEHSMKNLTLDSSAQGAESSSSTDPAKIMWSYIDPLGNVQGKSIHVSQATSLIMLSRTVPWRDDAAVERSRIFY